MATGCAARLLRRFPSTAMSQTSPSRAGPRSAEALAASAWWRQAWFLVLAGGIVMGMALGVRHVQGLFLPPLTLDRGWSRETFGFAIAVQNLTWGVMQPFAGMLADRYGSAKVVAGSLVFYALGLGLMAHAATPVALLWSAGICIGVALAGTSFAVVYGALSRLVPPERRSWALGLAGAIGGFGQFALVPGAQRLIDAWSWPHALLGLAAAMLVLLPLAPPLKDEPASRGPDAASMSIKAAIRDAFGKRSFWLLSLGFLDLAPVSCSS
jgi:MFS family permease